MGVQPSHRKARGGDTELVNQRLRGEAKDMRQMFPRQGRAHLRQWDVGGCRHHTQSVPDQHHRHLRYLAKVCQILGMPGPAKSRAFVQGLFVNRIGAKGAGGPLLHQCHASGDNRHHIGCQIGVQGAGPACPPKGMRQNRQRSRADRQGLAWGGNHLVRASPRQMRRVCNHKEWDRATQHLPGLFAELKSDAGGLSAGERNGRARHGWSDSRIRALDRS